jgi:hypothetical protein
LAAVSVLDYVHVQFAGAVIDADLGLSGRSATHRDGFKALVARVCLGEVGTVFGLEVFRLARFNADLAVCWSWPA